MRRVQKRVRPDDPRPLWRGRVLALLGIVLVAFSLRSAVASLSPILAEIQDDIAVPAWAVGLIGTAPPLCFALFGIVTPALERRFGLERLAIAAMVVVVGGLVGRAFAPDAGLLLFGTAVLFAGVGVGNVVTPPLIKRFFPDRAGLMTGLYSAILAVASFIPPLVAVPTADRVGWRFSLGMWAAFAVVAIIPWWVMLHRDRVAASVARELDDLDAPAPQVLGRLFRLPMAWALAATFAISSTSVYACFAWMPVILVDIAGVSHATAGLLLSLFGAIGIPLSILVPIVITRWRRVGILYGVALVAGLTAVVGLLAAPTAAPALWVVLLAVPQGLFPVALVLIQRRSRTHEGAVALSGFVQSFGYLVAATFPLAFAFINEATGDWTGALIMLGALMILAIPAGIIAARPRTIEDEWEHRHGAWR